MGCVYEASDLDSYYFGEKTGVLDAPLILSPSYVKFVYVQPLLDLWRGLSRGGGFNLGLNFIGFSLPDYDEYIKIGLHEIVTNYQESGWGVPIFSGMSEKHKDIVRFVDFQSNQEGEDAFKKRFSFVNKDKADFFFGGFNEAGMEFLFN